MLVVLQAALAQSTRLDLAPLSYADARWQSGVSLQSTNVAPRQIIPNQDHVIVLQWAASAPLDRPYRAFVDVAEGVLDALAGATPRYAVNAPFVAPEEWDVLAPYIKLGRQIGALCTALIQEPVRTYELEYRGELGAVATAPVRLAVLQGLLAGACEERVTPVNAPLLARERGLKYNEHATSEAESYAGLLVLRAGAATAPRW